MPYQHRMQPLPSQYDTAAIEKKWQKYWAEKRIYAWQNDAPREKTYVIDTPPPTVSGTLHMGHVFSYTQADFIARYQRMKGMDVFYPMGFDDNGLPTERLVEKTKKIRAVDLSREAFIAECLSVSEEARAEFRALFESIALSVDWDQEYHTISDEVRRLSQLSFLDLVQKDHCYRALRPFYWDPVDQTAIAQAEIVDKELPSFQNTILFEAEGTTLPIMTTRPELLPACVALFYHPEDTRYQHLKGKHARVPLFGHSVPILEDDTVEAEKGTGLMMCCTFGDDADIAKWQKHKLETRIVINKFGKIDFSSWHPHPPASAGPSLSLTEGEGRGEGDVFAKLTGKKVSNTDPKHLGARETILALLKEAGLLVDQKPITHAVKCAERSGAPLEILPTHQWFVRVTDKKEALKARAEECTWHPEWMKLRMLQWIDGLNQDWCISRQRYFGVPFPVWYVESSVNGIQSSERIYARPEDLPVNPLKDLPHGYQRTSDEIGNAFEAIRLADGAKVLIIPDPDVMDTWATSSISPQISAGAISSSVIPSHDGVHLTKEKMDTGMRRYDTQDRFSALFPADLRPQAHEIIRTWAFYTTVKAHLHSETIPWKNLMISGWCLAEDKSKMSKSKGNVVTPVALIEEKGTDAVRYWAATSRLGQDTAFSPDLLKIGKKLVGKLWNATAFAAIHLNKLREAPTNAATDSAITEVLDQWILTRLGQVAQAATKAFEEYEYAVALDATNQFFWADFCDNYLELIKARVYNEEGNFSEAAQQSAVRTLYYCLEGILKLYAPFVPHVTEELYAHIFPDAYAQFGSLHARGQWVNAVHYASQPLSETIGIQSCFVLEKLRAAKSDAKVSIKFPITHAQVQFSADFAAHEAAFANALADVKAAGNVEALHARFDGAAGTAPEMLSITLAESADAA